MKYSREVVRHAVTRGVGVTLALVGTLACTACASRAPRVSPATINMKFEWVCVWPDGTTTPARVVNGIATCNDTGKVRSI